MPKSSLEGSICPALEQEQRSTAHSKRENQPKINEKQSESKQSGDKSPQSVRKGQR